MKIILYLLAMFVLVCCRPAVSQSGKFDPSYVFLHTDYPIQDKEFYLLSLIEQLPEVKRVFQDNAQLKRLLQDKKRQLEKQGRECKGEAADCYVKNLMWSESDNRTVTAELDRIYGQHKATMKNLAGAMRSSGYFIRFNALNDRDLIKKAWNDAASNMNYILEAYTTNKGMSYPSIDSTTFAVSSRHYKLLVRESVLMLQHYEAKLDLFFEPLLRLSMLMLKINYRNEAVRFLPLDSANRKAYHQISYTDWDKCPYSLILVPGQGPESKMAISPLSEYRCQLGADLYRQGKAPFIVVSGGYVHPFQTPYCEAVEMKRYLIEKLNIPEEAIIIEPHARHTNTNIRNANRILYRQGIPADKRIICTSTTDQIDYILGGLFRKRCLNLMGYLPWRDMQQLDKYKVTYYPVMESLHIESSDPLDP